MELNVLDWSIIVGYFVLTLGIGVLFSFRAGRNLTEYFVSGRSLPWWLAGTSMVATTFAADTPLAVTGLVAKNGLAGNWFWWAFALGGMFTVFVYARMWRRAEVLTDVELVELRYGGRAAAVLRGVRAVYIALIVNPIIIGWVTGAMLTILKETVLHPTTRSRRVGVGGLVDHRGVTCGGRSLLHVVRSVGRCRHRFHSILCGDGRLRDVGGRRRCVTSAAWSNW